MKFSMNPTVAGWVMLAFLTGVFCLSLLAIVILVN